jgi:hypothetical protein
MPSLLQVVVLSAVLAYLWQCRVYMRRRNSSEWGQIAGRIGSDSSTSSLDDWSLWAKLMAAEMDRLRGDPRDLRASWTHFRNARIVLEMADYAERNSTSESPFVNPMLLISLRREAMNIRVYSLISLAKCAFQKQTS